MIYIQQALDAMLVPIKDEFHMLLEKWCQEKLGRSVANTEQLILNNPVGMFVNFHGYYLANRKKARAQFQ